MSLEAVVEEVTDRFGIVRPDFDIVFDREGCRLDIFSWLPAHLNRRCHELWFNASKRRSRRSTPVSRSGAHRQLDTVSARASRRSDMPLVISTASLSTAGVLLVAIVFVEWGGFHVLSLTRGQRAATPFQLTFARAGHAHAGVLVILALVAQLYVDAAHPSGILEGIARNGVPLAAILMPVGFFLSSAGRNRTEPNGLIWLLYGGTVVLAVGVLALGVSLLTA